MSAQGHQGHAFASGIAAGLALAVVAGLAGPASALDRTSTMSEWSEASAAEQKSLLESLGPGLPPSFKAHEDEILTCLNLAAQSSAHADLPVSEIAKACAEAAEPTPPGQTNDI